MDDAPLESEMPFEDHTERAERYLIDDYEQAEHERRYGASTEVNAWP